tara:strand:+ start:7019 stop:7714 length:696 start_codon:yes stop_codon:yes gene_type:complete
MVKIFLDTGSSSEIVEYNKIYGIKGFTTNPSLLKKYKNTNISKLLNNYDQLSSKPISVEVTKLNRDEMVKQAIKISKYSKNIYIKIPYYDYHGKDLLSVIKVVLDLGIKVNITAVFSKKQIFKLHKILKKREKNKSNIITSLFIGRITDTGTNPNPIIKYAQKNLGPYSQILWASTREIYNIFEAQKLNVDIITVTKETYLKYKKLYRKSLDIFSKETSFQFFEDGKNIKY